MGPALPPAAGSEEQKGGMEGTSLLWLCLLTVRGVGPAFSYSCFWASSSCHMWDSKCKGLVSHTDTTACQMRGGASLCTVLGHQPQAAAQTRDISAWPLGVAQASNIDIDPGCDRTTNADMSPRGTMSPNVATASDGRQHRPLRSGWTPTVPPQTSTRPQMAT